MRTVLVAVGVVIALLGVVWVLQGAGILLGSFMSNDPTWLWIGIVTVVVGVALLVFGLRLPGRPKETEPA
ncbi:MAG TPA: hypothetical protein VI999_08975 [Thermoplasmata archaeon]|nr:hypothetical protein [Thermoplasmata archaeon]